VADFSLWQKDFVALFPKKAAQKQRLSLWESCLRTQTERVLKAKHYLPLSVRMRVHLSPWGEAYLHHTHTNIQSNIVTP
jgi:hypothetical protein